MSLSLTYGFPYKVNVLTLRTFFATLGHLRLNNIPKPIGMRRATRVMPGEKHRLIHFIDPVFRIIEPKNPNWHTDTWAVNPPPTHQCCRTGFWQKTSKWMCKWRDRAASSPGPGWRNKLSCWYWGGEGGCWSATLLQIYFQHSMIIDNNVLHQSSSVFIRHGGWLKANFNNGWMLWYHRGNVPYSSTLQCWWSIYRYANLFL